MRPLAWERHRPNINVEIGRRVGVVWRCRHEVFAKRRTRFDRHLFFRFASFDVNLKGAPEDNLECRGKSWTG